jgi:hypothetical protein
MFHFLLGKSLKIDRIKLRFSENKIHDFWISFLDRIEIHFLMLKNVSFTFLRRSIFYPKKFDYTRFWEEATATAYTHFSFSVWVINADFVIKIKWNQTYSQEDLQKVNSLHRPLSSASRVWRKNVHLNFNSSVDKNIICLLIIIVSFPIKCVVSHSLKKILNSQKRTMDDVIV